MDQGPYEEQVSILDRNDFTLMVRLALTVIFSFTSRRLAVVNASMIIKVILWNSYYLVFHEWCL